MGSFSFLYVAWKTSFYLMNNYHKWMMLFSSLRKNEMDNKTIRRYDGDMMVIYNYKK